MAGQSRSSARLDDLQRWKATERKRGRWPVDAGQPAPEGACRVCAAGNVGDHTECLEGRARMAYARDLDHRDDLDHAAMKAFPRPRSGVTRTAA